MQFVAAIRQMLPSLPVIVTSGRLEEKAEAEFKSLQVAGFLHKHFSQADLQRALEALGTVVKHVAVSE